MKKMHRETVLTAVISASSRWMERQKPSRSAVRFVSTAMNAALSSTCLHTKIIQVVVEGVLAICENQYQWTGSRCDAQNIRTTHISCPISKKPKNRNEANAVALKDMT